MINIILITCCVICVLFIFFYWVGSKLENKKIIKQEEKEEEAKQKQAGGLFDRIVKDPIIYLKQEDEVDCCGNRIKRDPKVLIYKSAWMWPDNRAYPLVYEFYDVKDKRNVRISWEHVHEYIVEV